MQAKMPGQVFEMLISEPHKFIFIHIYKNAGTSITDALLPFAASRWRIRANALLNKVGIGGLYPTPYPGHITAAELIAKMGQESFDSYFSFAFVRNPWDWQVSLYNFMLKTPKHHQHRLVSGFRNFDEYIEWRCTRDVHLQKDFVYSGDHQLVDFIGRYENLHDDFQTICSRIGISARLPMLNVSSTRPYQDYYSRKSVELVRKTFEPDIRLLGYDFD